MLALKIKVVCFCNFSWEVTLRSYGMHQRNTGDEARELHRIQANQPSYPPPTRGQAERIPGAQHHQVSISLCLWYRVSAEIR